MPVSNIFVSKLPPASTLLVRYLMVLRTELQGHQQERWDIAKQHYYNTSVHYLIGTKLAQII